MTVEKEIFWEKISNLRFNFILDKIRKSRQIFSLGVGFYNQPLKINVQYDNAGFGQLLEEKFKLSKTHDNVPSLVFVKNAESIGLELPYYQYGYISEDKRNAIVFAASFGVFKSVISGFASFCLDDAGYVPVHGSVLAANSKGIILTGGTSAGKTTALLNLVELLIKSNSVTKILTDDWAVVSKQDQGYVAQTFDPSISLKEKDVVENPHLRFFSHDDLVESIRRKVKVSIRPENLYGMSIGTGSIGIDTVVLLKPEIGPGKLQHIDKDEFIAEVIDAAYHYPYISDEQIERHRKFWKGVVSELDVFSFATRPKSGKFQSMDDIRRRLL